MRDWEGGVLNKSVIDGAFKTVNIRERQVQDPDPRCSDPTGLYGACEISISNTYPGALSPCGHWSTVLQTSAADANICQRKAALVNTTMKAGCGFFLVSTVVSSNACVTLHGTAGTTVPFASRAKA